jgi:chemosensory pili system protein ChpA (sensor histidine kinase/response regulator)
MQPQDLTPVAWIADETRKALEAATKCLQRYRREADAAGVAFHVPGLQHLLQAIQWLRQSAGALHMVQLHGAARLADAMHSVAEHFAEQRLPCTDDAVAQLDQAGIAVHEYLQAVLAGAAPSPVELFPAYQQLMQLAGGAQAHPADLWLAAAPAAPLALDLSPAPALQASPAVRSRFDQGVLKLVRAPDPAAAQQLHELALGLLAGTDQPAWQAFWQAAAAYFQAMALGALPDDLYTKRTTSGVLRQYTALARGAAEPDAASHHGLLFYSVHAAVPADATADGLRALQRALGHCEPPRLPDYAQRRFGRMSPSLLAQARRRIALAMETWSDLAGGNAFKLKGAHEQFVLTADALAKLHDDSAVLMQALSDVAQACHDTGRPPSPALGREVAAALLYLETAYADVDRCQAGLRDHAGLLAQRLRQLLAEAEPLPAPDWLEALYRVASERRSLDTVVAELGRSLEGVEQALDQFFRAPRERAVLGKVLVPLAQICGVLAALDQQPAAQAVLRMRGTVERYLSEPHDPSDGADRQRGFEHLARNTAVLGALVGMLATQPDRARATFYYDAQHDLLLQRPAGDAAPTPAASPVAPDDADATASATPALQPPSFLNDADEWSRQLQTTLSAWAEQAVPGQAAPGAPLAHALADGATAVGYAALAALAERLATALTRWPPPSAPAAVDATPLLDAAEEIRRLLHQYAAGFLKPARDSVLAALEQAQAPLPPAQADMPALPQVFAHEATALVQQLTDALTQWHGTPDDGGLRLHALRLLHRLKGAAQMAGAPSAAGLAHALEDAAAAVAGDHASALQIAALQQQCATLAQSLAGTAPAAPRQVQTAPAEAALLPFGHLAGALHATVQHCSTALARPARLELLGADTVLPHALLQRLQPLLEPLVRNAVFHGIEDAATRAAAGKPAEGLVHIHAQTSPHALHIQVRDDGRGLDLPRIQAVAWAQGQVPTGAPLAAADAAALVLQPGFTTAEASPLAGRGIGLDLVRSELLALGGRIDIDSTPGLGTTVSLVVPHTAG